VWAGISLYKKSRLPLFRAMPLLADPEEKTFGIASILVSIEQSLDRFVPDMIRRIDFEEC
jgi:hypothetical protein